MTGKGEFDKGGESSISVMRKTLSWVNFAFTKEALMRWKILDLKSKQKFLWRDQHWSSKLGGKEKAYQN